MTTIYDVLTDLRLRFADNAARGAAFERLTQQYLLADPLYAGRFTDVWLWQDWPGRAGKVDTGIDVVAETVEGGLVAVQCKFYDEHHPVTKGDIDTFLSASGKHPFTERLVVSTTDKWSKHAEDALADQQIPVARIGIADLSESAVDWSAFQPDAPSEPLKLAAKKDLYPHQQAALDDVFDGFASSDRGKLIMACGTGKTFTSLKIAERATTDLGDTSHILFLVPSISLLNQTLREWTAETALTIRSYAVCSDTKVGKRATEDIAVHDLQIPATTDPAKLAEAVTNDDSDVDMVVVFSTYQSIDAVAAAQAAGVPDFDLIICDEAHRTTGVTLVGDDESAFVKVHDEGFIAGDKRLYMTATPRIFADETKSKAAEHDALLCSMDDPDFFGPELHRLGFGDAVTAGLLTDYKVLVLNVDEGHVSRAFQQQLATDGELNIEDAARIIGCWNGLAKRGTALLAGDGFGEDTGPMRRAVAFSRSIKDSKAITTKFAELIHHYTDGQSSDDAENVLRCELEHVDGTDNALVRNERLAWLKADVPDNTCRILSNARCLSEGVDVPELDAVLFLNPRNSVVDVVQSVGRVMRKADGKKYGYIILPVAIPEGVDPATALSDNKRYKVVWQVLQALRAHDDRFNAMVNQIELNKNKPGAIDVIGVGDSSEGPFDGDGGTSTGDGDDASKPVQGMLDFPVDDWRDAIYGKIVAKVGERTYWEQWADDIRQIADRHVTRIKTSIAVPANEAVFNEFVEELQSNLNPGITGDDAIDMLAQHLITKPVFDALFGSYEFSERNPVSRSMADMLELLDDEHVESEAKTLNRFYEQVRVRAAGIDNHEGRQKVITELYEQFFKKALPKTADAFGIVYTPIEIVDFILRAVNDALVEHFGTDLSSEGVQILDPFTGTGTFIVRLLQSGLIRPEDLLRKYTHELHANEILLLAYYIAAVNIEATFEQVDPDDVEVGDGIYVPFDGIVLTDTFQLAENADTLDAVLFPENNKRVARQKAQDIRVIIGNPPYSTGQDSENDDNKNQSYPAIDSRITDTYVASTTARNKNSLYDSYYRAFRWSTDRIEDSGIVCFVSNGGWIDSNSADGFRKHLAEEFDHIYVFNLRGNQRNAGERSRREGGKVFGSGSRSTVAITLLVRTGKEGQTSIRYRDIGDYLTAKQKLSIVEDSTLASIEWEQITPNEWHDWVNRRDANYIEYCILGDKPRKGQEREPVVFDLYSNGVKTQRDIWCWGSSQLTVDENMQRLIENFNAEVERFKKRPDATADPSQAEVDAFIDYDAKQVNWTRSLRGRVRKLQPLQHDETRVVVGSYRPFFKQHLYFEPALNEMVYRQGEIFPPGGQNIGITLTGASSHFDFCCLIGDAVPDLHRLDSSQCFPRYRYELPQRTEGTLFDGKSEPTKVDNITDAALVDYQERHGAQVTKNDIFFYVYGLLHSEDYRARYAADLGKALPRIPHVKDFQAFVDAGRALADLHLNYETVDPYPLEDPSTEPGFDGPLRVKKMKYPKVDKVNDRTRIVFNTSVTLSGIPEEAHRYMLGPRSAVEWLMDQYQVKTDQKSGITNDPNDWCDEHNDPRYIIDLIKRVVTVSVETMKIVDDLPDLDSID